MKKIFLGTFIFLTLIKVSFVDAFIWEGTDLDLYKKIDSWFLSLWNKLINNELKWSSAVLNDFLEKRWLLRYLDESSDFKTEEINEITKWILTPIYIHLKKDYLENKPNTSKIIEIKNLIVEWYKNKNSKIEKVVSNMNDIWSMWLYYDWDNSNSSYDLMTDLDKINTVIFEKNNPYDWKKSANDFKWWFKNILDNVQSLSETQAWINNNLAQNSWTSSINLASSNIIVNNTSTVNNLQGNSILSNKCLTGSINSLNNSSNSLTDTSLLNDIDNQLTNWTNNNTAKWWQSTQDSEAAPALNNWLSVWASLFDPFPCNNFFCITIDFVMYNQNLLGSGKSNSIESILTKNYKIAEKIAATALDQAEMTKTNYSFSILNGLFLGKMIHLWVQISFIPLPILSVNKIDSDSSWIKADFTDEQLYTNSFAQFWLKYSTQNSLSDWAASFALNNATWLNTSELQKKLSLAISLVNPTPSYNNTVSSAFKTEYLWNFNKDVMTLKSFSKELGSKMDTISNLIIKMKTKWE